MVPEQHPLVRRVVVLPVVEPVRGRDARVVEHRDLRREERRVVAVGDGEAAQHDDHHRHRVQQQAPGGGVARVERDRKEIHVEPQGGGWERGCGIG